MGKRRHHTPCRHGACCITSVTASVTSWCHTVAEEQRMTETKGPALLGDGMNFQKTCFRRR